MLIPRLPWSGSSSTSRHSPRRRSWVSTSAEIMQWSDEGIVLGSRRHGEANYILELLTRQHGRHLGLVRGGARSPLRPLLEPGNRISSTWRARLDEHLGLYAVEALDQRAAAFLLVPHALFGMTHLA